MVVERRSRTWLCSVVFLDIVGFSKRPVAGQLAVKQHLTLLIQDALREVPENDTILLDSGDGAAVCFLADPVEALFFALGLRNALLGVNGDTPRYACRIGINLGPVKVIKDVTGRRNTVGDGINSAQRVMDFAEPNQLLVSRSFHDVVACLSEEYQRLFSHLGIRRDKHVKEYDVYEVSGRASDLAPPPSEPRVASAPDVKPPAGLPGERFDSELLDHAARELAEHIGPLARILVQRAARRACSAPDLYEMLAQHLPDPGSKELFLAALSAGTAGAQGRVPSETSERPPTAVPQPGNAVQLDSALRERIRRRLAESQGPLAKVLIKRAASRARSLPELCRYLADELPEGEREAFVVDCLGWVGGGG